jgi:hypothetical protein
MIPELLNLGDFGITIAAVHEGTPLVGLEGMSRLTISARLGYGSGGTTVVAVVQTSLNQGTTWIDIARFDFVTAGLEKIMNLTTNTSLTTPYTVVSLAAEGGLNSILGDRLRSVVTSTGTYTGSTVLAVRAMAT